MFASNTGISTSHNYFIALNRGETRTFRVLLRPLEAGRLNWRFFFSNSVDSTWNDGTESYAGLAGGRFEIVSAAAGAADENAALTGGATAVGWPENIIEPKACVASAPVEINVPENGYIVYSWCLRALEDGCRLPATPDSQALCYAANGDHCFDGQDAFAAEPMAVLPDQFAADRDVHAQMVFMGDSITQGCGTRVNEYEQWAARIAMGMERDVAVWNIGLGYGRGADAAQDGAWLNKAKQGDIVNLCFGVNDIFQGCGPQLTENLRAAIRALHDSPKHPRVVLLTIPPFDMTERDEEMWRAAVNAIREDGLGADAVFDIASMLCQPIPRDNFAAFGGHPDGRGGAAVAGEYLSHFWPRHRKALLGE